MSELTCVVCGQTKENINNYVFYYGKTHVNVAVNKIKTTMQNPKDCLICNNCVKKERKEYSGPAFIFLWMGVIYTFILIVLGIFFGQQLWTKILKTLPESEIGYFLIPIIALSLWYLIIQHCISLFKISNDEIGDKIAIKTYTKELKQKGYDTFQTRIEHHKFLNPEADASLPSKTTYINKEQVEELFDAIAENNIEEVRKKLKEMPKLVESCDDEGAGVFHIVDDIEIAKILYKHSRFRIRKSLINAQRNKSYSTPLHHAATHGNLEIVKFLVSKGANVNAESQGGTTAIRWAAIEGHINVVDFLRKHGASENISDVTEYLQQRNNEKYK